MDSTNLDFGKELRAGRKQVGLSQAELARKLHVKPTYVAKMEAGLIIASESEKKALASILSLPSVVRAVPLKVGDIEFYRHPPHCDASAGVYSPEHTWSMKLVWGPLGGQRTHCVCSTCGATQIHQESNGHFYTRSTLTQEEAADLGNV